MARPVATGKGRTSSRPPLVLRSVTVPADQSMSSRPRLATSLLRKPRARAQLVQDNLSTHTPAALYEAFPADEARRFVERFEWHYTPKHGSWLNLAESELGVLSSQCLNRRMSDKRFLKSEVAAWEANRNKKHTKAN
jgi:hypothetical protein